VRARGEAPQRLPRDRADRLLAPATSTCPGCGLELPRTGGQTHPYIGASAECWGQYGELLALDYGELDMPDFHRLTVDTYAAQHPGEPGRRAEQSVAVHLAGLYLVLERDADPDYVHRLFPTLTEKERPFGWLEPPPGLGTVTVADVLDASCHEEYGARVRDWAMNVWAAWEPHQATIRAWLDEER